MKKSFLFGLLAILLAGFGFGGISMADEVACPDAAEQSLAKNTAQAVAQIGTTCYDSLRAAVEAANAADGSTIDLINNDETSFNAAHLEIWIKTNVTINGNNYYVKGVSDALANSNDWHDIYISSGDVTIKNLTITNFGDAVTTNRYISPIYVGHGYEGKLTLENVTINTFNRQAVHIGNGDFEITDCRIVGNGSTYQQGIEIFTDASGTITNTTVTGSKGTESWDAYAIGNFGNGTVTVTDSTINDSESAIAVGTVGDPNLGYASTNGKITLSGGNNFTADNVLVITKSVDGYDTSSTIEIITGSYNGEIIKSDNATDASATIEINGGKFSNNPSDYIAAGKYAKNISENPYLFEVTDLPEPTREFVTNEGNKIPVVYTEEGENITISEEETKALLTVLLSQVPEQDPTGTRTLLSAIIAANSFNNLVEIKKIDDNYVLFVNALGHQTKGFIQDQSTLTFNPYAFKNGTPINEGEPISYDITKAINPSWVTPSKNDVTSYNTVSKNQTVIGYTLNMNNVNDGWFYAPKLYTITFDKANCPTVDNTTAGDAPTQGNANCTSTETVEFLYGAQVERTGETPTKANDADCTTSYKFTGWSPALSTVTGDATYTAQYECTPKSTSSAGGGGGSSYSCKNLPSNATANNTTKPKSNTNYSYSTDTGAVCTFQCNSGYAWNETNSKCEKAEANTGDTTDEPKTDEPKADDTTADPQEVLSDGLTRELHDAYNFAHKNGVTTMPSPEKANMYGPLTRIAMAKMLSQYAINVLGKKPANVVVPEFSDVTAELNEEYSDAVTLAYQLGIMGINIEEYRPFDPVIRAEFATALSRMLYSTPDGEYEGTSQYYVNHLKKLVEEKIITKNDPFLQELRGYVMIMLMRAAE